MAEEDLFAQIAHFTADLREAPGTPSGELDRLRRYVAAAEISSISDRVHRRSPLAAPLESKLRAIARESRTLADPSLRIQRRSAAALATAEGMLAASLHTEVIGPFESDDLDLIWFDVWREVEVMSVVDVTNRRMLMLPRVTLGVLVAAPGITRFEMPAGAVWLLCRLFDPLAPENGFAGLRIESGEIELSEPASVQNGALVLVPGTSLTLRARIATPPTMASAPHAGDARSLQVAAPREITLVMPIAQPGRLARFSGGMLRVIGSRIDLSEADGVAHFDADLSRLCLRVHADQSAVDFDDSRSALFRPRGKASIARSSWALPVAMASAGVSSLGEPGYSGYVIELGADLSATYEPLRSNAPIALRTCRLLAEPSRLTTLATTAPANLRHELRLWARDMARGSALLRSRESLVLRSDAIALLAGSESLMIQSVACEAQVDRPLTASGRNVPMTCANASVVLIRVGGTDVRLFLFGLASAPQSPIDGSTHDPADVSFALSNALVRASAPESLHIAGTLNGVRDVPQGTMQLRCRPRFVLPALPDPYAANVYQHSPRRWAAGAQTESMLIARVHWSPEQLAVSFDFEPGDLTLAPAFMPIEPAQIEPHAGRVSRLRFVEELFARASGQSGESVRLLDVSSKADQFGVSLSPSMSRHESSQGVGIRGLDLVAPARNVSAITLPAFQWEPVYNIPSADAGPFPAKVTSATDGGPTRLATPTATLVPLAPIPVVETLVRDYRDDANGRLAARFTLPFGMVAVAAFNKLEPMPNALSPPHINTVQPNFTGSRMNGGLQLALESPAHLAGNLSTPPGLPGATVQSDNTTSGTNVLRAGTVSTVDYVFNETFAKQRPMVPVQRVDFSGYGASIFSDWRRTDSKATGVTQARFDAIVGRTAHEVVQVRAKLVPWGARVVRIVTMERTGSGGVFRRDSGWQATSDADYGLDGCVVHPGVVPRLTNIRRIRDTSSVYERTYGAEVMRMTQVIFDADVVIEGLTAGGNASRRVPARDIVGYVQLGPVESGTGNIADLQPQWVDDLLQHTGPIGVPLDCEIDIGASGVHMRVARIEVDRTVTLAGTPELAAIARGTPELAGAGQWTFAYRGSGEDMLHRLSPDVPLPLIRANAVAGVPPPYRFADASELHRLTQPHSEYALLHSSGAQRLSLPQPQVRAGESAIHAASALLLADMYALAGEVGFFPRPDRCHPLPAGSLLRITGRRKARLEIPPQGGLAPSEFKVALGERVLADSAGLRVRAQFQPDATVQLVIDSDVQPDWSCRIGPITATGDVQGLSGLMQVHGTIASDSGSPAELENPQLSFGSVLSPVQAIVDFLTAFGLPLPFSVDITNTSYAFSTGVKYTFPDYWPFAAVEHALKHGLGVMLEIELKASFGKEDKNIGTAATAEHPILGALTPWTFAFEYESKLMTKCVHPFPVFLGGTAKFEIEGSTGGHESKVLFQGGFGGAVELEVPMVAEVSGSRSYMLVSRVSQENGEVKVGMGVATGWEVEFEFLEGLAAAALSFEMLVILERGNEFHCQGEATLAIDVTLGWVLSKTFEVEVTMNEKLAVAAFAAATVLP